jgi:5-methylcytosine-specific restriction endonuclease McrA
MTLSQASEITGYEVAITFQPPGSLTLTALDDNATVAYSLTKKRCTKRTSPQQMKDMAQAFVDWNWKRNCQTVFEAQEWRCARCGKMKALQGHHHKRRSRGRDDRVTNIIGLCSVDHVKADREQSATPVEASS